MVSKSAAGDGLGAKGARDPREESGAEVIDLATRNVLPQVSQRRKGDGLGMAAGVLIVGALGALTLWTMSDARKGAVAPQPVVTPAPPPITPP
ncbi:type VI secretion protein, partial [Novosphingobium sp. 1949]|nr:type VI secretion protein [Novosphingobium organovorum]